MAATVRDKREKKRNDIVPRSDKCRIAKENSLYLIITLVFVSPKRQIPSFEDGNTVVKIPRSVLYEQAPSRLKLA